MKPARVAGTLFVLVFVVTMPAHAQVRGRLTSRAAAPATVPRPPLPSRLLLPFWTPSDIATLAERNQVGPPVVGDGAPTGGVQLDIQPWNADVYVDGRRAGRVEQFRGYYQHLELPAGPHLIAIVASGYEPMLFSVTVVPGRTLTSRATLQR